MALTPSTMLKLGTQVPQFALPDPFGKIHSTEDYASSKLLLVAFLCNHCPYVQHIRGPFAQLVREYQPKGLACIGVNSNDASRYPDDSPEKMITEIRMSQYTFPYLIDESQDVAKAYRAACTPDFYLFDQNRALVYRGQLDDSRPSNGKPVTCYDLKVAIEAALHGHPVELDQKPSMGCNIKWKPGNEPDYFKS